MILRVNNWKSFQHYKDRSPPWIRLHRTLLDNKDFHRLPVESRALAPMLWLLASESMDGAINADADDLSFRLRTTECEIKTALQPLIDKGFFVVERDASAALSDGSQPAVPEAEAESLQRTEADDMAMTGSADQSTSSPPTDANSVQTSRSRDDCPHLEIINLFHEILPTARRVRDWTAARAAHLRARWREDQRRQSLDWWRKLFVYVSQSPFLTGKTTTPGRKPFELGLEWLVTAENFAKVREGKYHESEMAT